MLVWLLFLAFALGTVLIYMRVERNVASPTILFLVAYTVSLFLAATQIERWSLHLRLDTFLIVLIGGIEFVAVGLLVRQAFTRRRAHDDRDEPSAQRPALIRPVRLHWAALLAIDVVLLGTIGVYLASVIRVVSASGVTYQGVGGLLGQFKALTSIANEASLPGWVSRLYQIAQVLAYFLVYVSATWLVAVPRPVTRRWVIKAGGLALGVLSGLVLGFLSSDRLAMMALGIGLLVLSLLFWQERKDTPGLSPRAWAIGGLGVVVFLGLFYAIAPLVGRSNILTPLQYAGQYGGGPIATLNSFLSDPPPGPVIPGQESFYSLDLKLFTMGWWPDLTSFPPIHLEARFVGSTNMSNVYTAYRRWIYDFGLPGAAILNALTSAVINFIYCVVRYSGARDRAFWAVLYGMLAYTSLLHPIDSYLTVIYAAPTFVTVLVITKLVVMAFTRIRIVHAPAWRIRVQDPPLWIPRKRGAR